MQRKGFASEAIELLIQYSFTYLAIHQLYVNITSDNIKSLHLFTKHNFNKVGIKKDWLFNQGIYKDEILLQLINEK